MREFHEQVEKTKHDNRNLKPVNLCVRVGSLVNIIVFIQRKKAVVRVAEQLEKKAKTNRVRNKSIERKMFQ